MCSVLASLVLENKQVGAGEIGLMSIYQYTNSGPTETVFSFLPAWIGKGVLGLLAVGLLVLESTFLNFSSTILLSDLDKITLPHLEGGGFEEVKNINYTTHSSTWNFLNKEGMNEVLENEYPIFAEKIESDPARIFTNNTFGGLVDSGTVLRAFLPIPQAERETLSAYRGPARTLGFRSVCFAPKFLTPEATLVESGSSNILGPNGGVYDWPTSDYALFSGMIVGDPLPRWNNTPNELASLEEKYWDQITFPRVSWILTMDKISLCKFYKFKNSLDIASFKGKPLESVELEWMLVSIPSWRNENERPKMEAS